MKHWSSRQFIALFLGVFLALGMSLSAVQASDMAVQMAMAGDVDMSGQGDCDGCGGSGDDSVDAVTCSPMLSCSGMAALLSAAGGLVATQTIKQVAPVSSVARDLTAPPDPYPPRSLNLG
jgi:hypothetical protein